MAIQPKINRRSSMANIMAIKTLRQTKISPAISIANKNKLNSSSRGTASRKV